MLAMWISLISNILLTGGKIIAGVLFNSQVLLADGVHNAGDVIATGAALSSIRVSSRPADEDHPYGHGKAEVVGSAAVAILLILAALYIGYHSILALFAPVVPAEFTAFIVAIVSLLWKLWLYVYSMKIGRAKRSKALIATAYDHLADVYASVAAVAGIGLGMIGDKWDIPLLQFGDPVAGIVVSALVLKLAVQMGKEATDILMEKSIDAKKLEEFASLVNAVEHVKRIDRIRARELGHYILVDVRVSVPAQLSIQEGHDVSRNIKNAIMNKYTNVDEVLIHLNPWYESVD
ncbi:MAG TPA: cation diffusion facilitator family transporter [Bacilli bacterium]